MIPCYLDGECENNSPNEERTRRKSWKLPCQDTENTQIVVYAVFHFMYPCSSCAIQLYVPFRKWFASSSHAVSHAGLVGRPIIILREIPQHIAVDHCFCLQVAPQSTETLTNAAVDMLPDSVALWVACASKSTFSRVALPCSPLHAHLEVALMCLCLCAVLPELQSPML